MNAFDKVIGYKATKRELLQLCDMLRNREIYEEMGARLPHGLLLYGDPGLGKTLLARCFVEESGLHTITVRRDKGGDAFIDGITQAFASAKAKAPSIVLLDDMDKFANEDDTHCDAPEYAAVQAGIDDVKDTGVFVIATANDIRKLPSSLRRSGRFDRKIGLQAPTASDAEEIIAHYLKTKRVSDSVNMEDLTRMMRYNSCAELETILNEAVYRLTSITIPAGVTRIEEYTFHCCMNLTDAVIPEGVTSVGKLAFACCHELTMARMSSRSFH